MKMGHNNTKYSWMQQKEYQRQIHGNTALPQVRRKISTEQQLASESRRTIAEVRREEIIKIRERNLNISFKKAIEKRNKSQSCLVFQSADTKLITFSQSHQEEKREDPNK